VKQMVDVETQQKIKTSNDGAWVQKQKNNPIGIFDSGVGGLTVLKAVQNLLPNEQLIYVGDTARAPYGCKTKEQLLQYGKDIIEFLHHKNCKAIVMACGSSSSNTYTELCDLFPDVPLIDVIRPGVDACEALYAKNPQTRFALLATTATIRSGMFVKMLSDDKSSLTIHSRRCPMFASMIESGQALIKDNPLLMYVAEQYIGDLKNKVDAVVLGCTHYPMIADTIKKVLGDVTIINLSESAAQQLYHMLKRQHMFSTHDAPPKHEFYVSGDMDMFQKIAGEIMGIRCIPKTVTWESNKT